MISPERFATAFRNRGSPIIRLFHIRFIQRSAIRILLIYGQLLEAVPAVDEPSRPLDLKFPFNFRSGLKLWRYVFLDEALSKLDPTKSVAWNRGKYIVEGPAHCGACHTPRNLAGARKFDLRLQGADNLLNGGKSPPITTAKLLANGWTVSNLKYALKTGVQPDGDVFGGAMGEIVHEGTSFLNDNDLVAIAIYLLDKE